MGSSLVPIQPGLHLGVECPINPTETAIFDFLPRRLYPQVVNLSDLALALVFDCWTCHVDSRQTIFFRGRGNTSRVSLRTVLIDNGLCFGGSKWEFHESHLSGLYMDRYVYSLLDMAALCQRNVDLILQIEDDEILSTPDGIPEAWYSDGDHVPLAKLLAELCRRKDRLRACVSRKLEAIELFDNVSTQ
jgi:hypothetical protein